MAERAAACADDVAQAPDLRTALRHATATRHRILDRSLEQRALLEPGLTPERYATIMARHRRALATCEASLAAHEFALPAELPPYRPRLAALDADLAALGCASHATGAPDRATATPVAARLGVDPAIACGRYLGMRYVLEGSTQGAAAIGRRLELHLPALRAHAFAYWRVQGEEAPAWRTVALHLGALPARGALADAAIAAAQDGFGAFLHAFGLAAPDPSDPAAADAPRAAVQR